MSEHTLNIPQLLVILIITGLVVRWFFSKQSTTSDSGTRQASRQNARSRVNPAHVEQISQMFPQADRRQIMWDLHRNGGNMHATTERILSGRPLEVPPPTFQPAAPTPPRSTTPSANSRATSAATPQRSQHPDLITRYNLSSKIDAEAADGEEPSKARWSQSKTERQMLLQKRRDEMILAARRKMLEKDKAKEKGKEKEVGAGSS